MGCFSFSDLRIFSLSIPLCEWLTSTPFLLLVYYLFFCWIFAVALVWCLGIKFHKSLLDFICHHILHQHSRSCLPDLGAQYHLMYLLAINQALPYGCSFVTYGHPEGSAAGDITIITIIWNDVFK